MERPGFGDRFGYLLWLRHLRTGAAPAYEEVGAAVKRSGVAVSAWRVREDPPPDYRVHDPFVEFFDVVDARGWVIDGKGEPPEPELWNVWARHRRAEPKAVPAGAAKQITRADVVTGKKTPAKKTSAK